MAVNTEADEGGAGTVIDLNRIEAARRLDGGSSPLEVRIVRATIICVARWGLSKTTLDDIAREAGCSRATIYRVFPGGKDTLLLAVATTELERFFRRLEARLASADTLEDALVLAVNEAITTIRDHRALQYLVENEPEAIYPHISFDGLDPLLSWSSAFAMPQLQRFVPERTAAELGEWLARLMVSYGFQPEEQLDLADQITARRFVRTFILPSLDQPEPALSSSASGTSTSDFTSGSTEQE